MPGKVWFITGASSGFGRAMTELLLKNGEIVIATLRKPEALADLKYGPDRLLVLKLDVTKRDDVDAAFAKAKEAFGRIDVVYNNAAFGILGEFESSTRSEEARYMFEVDFWGANDISRAAVEFFRTVNGPKIGGTLLVMSSEAGHYGVPALSYYCAAKHALEGATDGLAKELVPAWNIKVSLIVSGAFRTSALDKIMVLPAHPEYKESASAMSRDFFPNIQGADVNKGVEILYKLSQEQDLPLRFPLGKDGVKAVRGQIATLTADVDKYAAWSDSL